jgi:transglutaminase-like putative cysteine protease
VTVSLRRAVGLAVLAVWVVAVGFHVRREYFRSEVLVLEAGARSLGPGTHFYTVEMGGHAIGLATSRLDTVPGGGFLFEDMLQLDVPALGTLRSVVVRTRSRLGPALELIEFEFQLRSDGGDYRVRGDARGDSILDLRMDAGAGEQEFSLRMAPATTLPAALPLRMAAAGRLGVGREYTARVVDPSALADRPVTVRVTGRDRVAVADSVARDAGGAWQAVTFDTLSAWVVEEHYGGIRVRSWLDDDGRIVRSESPAGFSIRRLPFELADQAWRRGRADPALAAGYGIIIESTAIASNRDLRGVATDVDRLVVRLRNVETDGLDLDGGRQRLRGDTLVIVREPGADLAAAYRLPWDRGGDPAGHLAASPLVQAHDPRIVATALRIADGSTSPTDVARRLNDWVHRSLRKEITPGIPSAVQVLDSMRGDCNEHTVLYVALARSLGLPARKAAGVVHLDGRFYYHAWPEVWLGDWVAVDPTLGQFPADPSHIRFIIGGLARQVELIRLIGRVELDILGTGP